jgi:hypothetical protein
MQVRKGRGGARDRGSRIEDALGHKKDGIPDEQELRISSQVSKNPSGLQNSVE